VCVCVQRPLARHTKKKERKIKKVNLPGDIALNEEALITATISAQK